MCYCDIYWKSENKNMAVASICVLLSFVSFGWMNSTQRVCKRNCTKGTIKHLPLHCYHVYSEHNTMYYVYYIIVIIKSSELWRSYSEIRLVYFLLLILISQRCWPLCSLNNWTTFLYNVIQLTKSQTTSLKSDWFSRTAHYSLGEMRCCVRPL